MAEFSAHAAKKRKATQFVPPQSKRAKPASNGGQNTQSDANHKAVQKLLAKENLSKCAFAVLIMLRAANTTCGTECGRS